MSDMKQDALDLSNSEADAEAFAAERDIQITRFVRTNPGYYRKQFGKIGSASDFAWTFNLWAAVFGSIWFAARSMWNWGLSFLILETFAIVQIVRGFLAICPPKPGHAINLVLGRWSATIFTLLEPTSMRRWRPVRP